MFFFFFKTVNCFYENRCKKKYGGLIQILLLYDNQYFSSFLWNVKFLKFEFKISIWNSFCWTMNLYMHASKCGSRYSSLELKKVFSNLDVVQLCWIASKSEYLSKASFTKYCNWYFSNAHFVQHVWSAPWFIRFT